MIVVHHRAVLGGELQHVVGCIVRVRDELAAMMAEETPVRVAGRRFEISILDNLLGRAVRIAHHAHVVEQHHAGVEQADAELVPTRGPVVLPRHHAIRHRLPGSLRALVAVRPRLAAQMVGFDVAQLETRATAIAPATFEDARLIDRIARRITQQEALAALKLAGEVADNIRGVLQPLRPQRRCIPCYHHVAARWHDRPVRETEIDARVQPPARQVHAVG